jgi:cystathionine gamma-synthase
MPDSFKLISRQPPGGRCTLYADYLRQISLHLAVPVTVSCHFEPPHDAPRLPALVVHGKAVEPADEVVLSPDDVCARLAEVGIDPDHNPDPDLRRALKAALERLLT